MSFKLPRVDDQCMEIALASEVLYSLAYNGHMRDAAGTSSYSPGEPVNAHMPILFNVHHNLEGDLS